MLNIKSTIVIAPNSGFCFGVTNAIKLAKRASGVYAGKKIATLGRLIHNDLVVSDLKKQGVDCFENIKDFKAGDVCIIRSHGVGKKEIEFLQERGVTIIDATCPFVKKIHDIVDKEYSNGKQIIILGKDGHPEVEGINGWCGGTGVVVGGENEVEEKIRQMRNKANKTNCGLDMGGEEMRQMRNKANKANCGLDMGLDGDGVGSKVILDNSQINQKTKYCVVVQTTFDVESYKKTVKKISQKLVDLVEFNKTICYTTHTRQVEAHKLSQKSDIVLVLGSKNSSNTIKLFDIAKLNCTNTYLISSVDELSKVKKNKNPALILILAGASTPNELIVEVKTKVAQKFEAEIQNADFLEAMQAESQVSLREGSRVKGTVISADAKGVSVNISTKKDGFIPAEEASLEGYDPLNFPIGAEVDAVVVTTKSNDFGCIILSRRTIELAEEGDKLVETIRDGGIFEIMIQKETNGGLLSKLGTYTVFVPASQIREGFVKDLKQFANKPMRLTAIEVDDKKKKIVASAKKIIVEEKKAREEVFWSAVQPDVIVTGKVKRITNFGAFVAVDGFDCLVHITDISWNKLKSAEEILKIGKSYDFLVLSVDKERGRVSLSYKALQPHPFEAFMEKYPIGTKTSGKITSIVPFGAFVEVAEGIEGLVHVSEASHTFIKSVSEINKVGDTVDVIVKDIDTDNRKITLSIKACNPEGAEGVEGQEEAGETKAKKAKGDKAGKNKSGASSEGTGSEWAEEVHSNPLAALLKDIDVE